MVKEYLHTTIKEHTKRLTTKPSIEMASLSEMPVDVLHQFPECYLQFCALKNTHALLAVKKYLPKKMIDFVCDTFTVTEWSILLRCLKYDKSLNCISIRSRKAATTEVLDQVDTKEKASAIEKQRHPLLYTKYIKLYLMKSLKMCLTNHSELKCLRLEGLPIQEEDITIVTNGLMACTSLSHLSFNKSHLGDSAISQICHVLKHKPSIASIDFGDCDVGEEGVDAIARMIVYQNLCRHDEGWKQSLRDRVPTLDKLPGLRRITLNQNKAVGDKGVQILIEALLDDQYIKALDLQECGVTSNIADKLIALLEKNTAIKIVDVRCNENLLDRDLQAIMETLSTNNDGEIHEFTWLDLPYKLRPIRAYSSSSTSSVSVRSIGVRRELSMASIPNKAGSARKPTMQRTHSFAAVTKNTLASAHRKTPLPQTKYEEPVMFTAPPPSRKDAEPLPDVRQPASPVKKTESGGNNVMAFQKCDVTNTDAQETDSSSEVDGWRLQPDQENHDSTAVNNNMRKAQSYHCKPPNISADKSLMKNVSKSESVVNESLPSHAALEKNAGDNASSRYRLDVQLARLEKRSGSTISGFTSRNAASKDKPAMTPSRKTSGTHLSVNANSTGSSNRIMPHAKSSKTTATVFCEATLNKMTMDQYNKYVYERNKNGISSYVPEPSKIAVKKSASTKKLEKKRHPPLSRGQSKLDSKKTGPAEDVMSGYPTHTNKNKSQTQTLEFSSDEDEVPNTKC